MSRGEDPEQQAELQHKKPVSFFQKHFVQRFESHKAIARSVYAEPRSLGGHVRDGFVSLWVSRGAGFFGLGWVITFIVLEINLFAGELLQAKGVLDFLGGQLLEYIVRFGVLSVVNSVLAFIWPVYLLQWLSFYGIILLVVGYFAFERLLRPLVEERFPELREARRLSADKAQKKTDKKEKKLAKKQDKRDKKTARKQRKADR